jgi:hypothetical protein
VWPNRYQASFSAALKVLQGSSLGLSLPAGTTKGSLKAATTEVLAALGLKPVSTAPDLLFRLIMLS